MAQDHRSDGKRKRLRRQSNLNPRAENVSDPLFEQDAFFDPRDLMQVKYEMLRRVRVDDQPISKAAANFGFSRPAFYAIWQAFERCGLSGLLPKKRGPQRRHKLSDDQSPGTPSPSSQPVQPWAEHQAHHRTAASVVWA